MAQNFMTSINLSQNELQNARLQNLGSAPANPKLGQIYYNSAGNKTYIWNGTIWNDITRQVTVVGTGPVSVVLAGEQYTVSVPVATTSTSGLLLATEKIQLNTLTADLASKAPSLNPVLTGLPKIRTSVTKALGNASTEAFRIESSDLQPLFQVKTNGDTVLAGILTVNGTGTSTFAGDVSIAGNLNVDGAITTGTKVNLGQDLEVVGNLVVKGDTFLGDDSSIDRTVIKGYTEVTSKANKAVGSSTAAAFKVQSKDALALFEVMENGDAKIAGVLTVSAVNSGGSGSPGTNLTGTTTMENLVISGNLEVKGNTLLGDNATTDTTNIKGVTTVHSKTTKALGSAVVSAFGVKDSIGGDLFQVMENGDTIIAGVLKVKGTGESEFAGDVKIGGNLTVMGNATVKGVMTGNDFNIQGNLNVSGNTNLGDNAAQDTTTINGFTLIKTAGTITSTNAATTTVFKIQDANATPASLFEVRQNGDTVIGGNLTVTGAAGGGGTATKDLVVDGDLTVKGNTILGDNAADTITLTGITTSLREFKMNGNKITGLAEPTNGGDAATKNYVDATAQGLDTKGSVHAATTANITLTGLQTIDGVVLVAGDRVLVKNQTTASQNGIYIAAAGAWVRSNDADTSAKFTAGMYVFVEEGTVNSDTGWVLSTNGDITINTTAIAFTQFSGAGTYSAGNGLNLTGTVLSAVGVANRISVAAGGIDIASTYAGQTSITTLGTIGVGTWNATTIAVAKGGTGATTAVAARANLGAVGKFVANVGNATLTEFSLAHGLGTQDVQVAVIDNVSKQIVFTDIEIIDANTVKVLFSVAPTANAYRVVIVG